jgi:photosystem II stability/assembly factor-like uncharacterized protein
MALLTLTANAQWIKQKVDTTASFRGLAVVNEKVVWASGTGGTVVRTIDGGRTWKVMTVPGAESLDFRDIEAFDANTAYVLSIGNGDLSRIYKTTDGGKTWKLQFQNDDPKKFFDAIACWDADHCIAMSDPVDQVFQLIETRNGGQVWTPMSPEIPPSAKKDEAAFAASGTCLITQGKDTAFIVTGGGDARVLPTASRGFSWWSAPTPIVKGSAGQGIFGIAMFDAKNGVIVGGDYQNPTASMLTFAKTIDGGRTWGQGTNLNGYRSGVAYIDRNTIIAVGTTGTDISTNGGDSWKPAGKEDLNAVQAKGRKATWAVGPKGLVVKLK